MSSYHHQKREQPTRAQEGQKPNQLYRFEKQEWERSPFWLLMQSEWTPVTFHLRLTPCQDSKAKARNPCPGLGAQQRPHDYFKGKTSDSYGWVTKNAGSKGSKPRHESPLDQWLLAVEKYNHIITYWDNVVGYSEQDLAHKHISLGKNNDYNMGCGRFPTHTTSTSQPCFLVLSHLLRSKRHKCHFFTLPFLLY